VYKSKKWATLVAVAALAMAGVAHATNDGGVAGNCGNGQGAGQACLNSGTGGAGGQGGAGGTGVGIGGQGGNASANSGAVGVGVGIGQGGKASATAKGGNASVKSSNTNLNVNSSTSAVRNSGNSESKSTSNSGGNTQSNAGNNSAVSVTGDNVHVAAQERNPVAGAWAAPLTAANGTCMGSTSGGAQGVSLGVSFGSTWTDSDCDRRYDANVLHTMGQTKAATALMCQKATVRDAMAAAGTPCPAPAASSKVASAQPETINSAVYSGSDPIVIERLRKQGKLN
jgi:hypothetical protein